MAKIFFGGMQWAELNQEQETLEVEFYPRPDGQPWRINCNDATTVLGKARRRLLGEESEKWKLRRVYLLGGILFKQGIY
ncbi:MAG: hypothetical protein AB7P24_11530 [Nitrospira sp.]